MIGELLRHVMAATILGCVALYLAPKGAMREVLRLAAGAMILLSLMQPVLQLDLVQAWLEIPEYTDTIAVQSQQEAVFREAMAVEAEQQIAAYFAAQGMEVEVRLKLDESANSRVILCPAQAYDWTKEDAARFTAWSGIAEEQQEWIWK